jgi:antitoxin ParD1/3/4
MGTMNISLPDDMKDFIDEQVSQRGYGTSSEFLRDLIRREQERLHMRQLMLDAMASPKVSEADALYFQKYRDKAEHARKSSQKSANQKSTGKKK